MDIVVNVADAKISGHPEDSLLTHALGSCIAVTLYDEKNKIGGLLHFQLPSATENHGSRSRNPDMFADSGMSHVLSAMERMGARLDRLTVMIVGGAEMLNDGRIFDIGRRNSQAIHHCLSQHGLEIAGEQLGGKQPRSVRMAIADGTVLVKSNGKTFRM